MSYIFRLESTSSYYKTVHSKLKHNTWLLSIHDNDHITRSQAFDDFKRSQIENNTTETIIVIYKRSTIDMPTKTLIQ